jgi:hypothetical protein
MLIELERTCPSSQGARQPKLNSSTAFDVATMVTGKPWSVVPA